MKKWGDTIAITVFAIIAIVEVVHDFVVNETIHYFADEPRRLMLVASIAMSGGLAALVFERLSPYIRRRIKLYALGSALIFLIIFTGYFLFEFAGLSRQIGTSGTPRAFILVPICLAAIILVLGFEFYHVFKKRVG